VVKKKKGRKYEGRRLTEKAEDVIHTVSQSKKLKIPGALHSKGMSRLQAKERKVRRGRTPGVWWGFLIGWDLLLAGGTVDFHGKRYGRQDKKTAVEKEELSFKARDSGPKRNWNRRDERVRLPEEHVKGSQLNSGNGCGNERGKKRERTPFGNTGPDNICSQRISAGWDQPV